MQLSLLPFIREIELTARFKQARSLEMSQDVEVGVDRQTRKGASVFSLDYGASLNKSASSMSPHCTTWDTTGRGSLLVYSITDFGFRHTSHLQH